MVFGMGLLCEDANVVGEQEDGKVLYGWREVPVIGTFVSEFLGVVCCCCGDVVVFTLMRSLRGCRTLT